jgi:DNA gyrase subunit A
MLGIMNKGRSLFFNHDLIFRKRVIWRVKTCEYLNCGVTPIYWKKPMELGLVHSIDINEQMQQAYLDYAMSVIVARALPDARDGLKPVHRRILYGMYDMGLRPDSATKKSARIVGEVMGKYHPHGDMPVYEAMARMAQDFSMRYLLVDGQGNFGSVDGDPPAAMRYTEARLAAPSIHMLADIGKGTVNFIDNFDGSLQEPDVLPAAIPNLLVNGATGIAVGMSTNIPPHNLGEVVDALRYMLANWENLDDVNIEDLMNFIKGPDFPTGGVILENPQDEGGLIGAYSTGRGKVIVQARLHVEEMERGRNRIIVTELPYQVNKSALIERIADLVRQERLEGIADLRDESDRHGMRIVIELTKTAEPDKVLHALYKSTPMRDAFNIILLALVGGEPRMLSLKQALRVYLDHRLVVIRRRSEYDLEKARQRAHILEGYLIALKNLDAVIDLIRKSPDADTAKVRLMKRFRLSDLQAQAILDMQLRRLAALERKKIEEEYKAIQTQIKALVALLKSPKKMRELCSEELGQVKELYGDRRRTVIMGATSVEAKGVAPLPGVSLAPEQIVWVCVTDEGLISRTEDEKSPRISGNAAPKFLLQANSRDVLYLVAENGEATGLPVHTLPEAENPAEGTPYPKVTALLESDKLVALFTLPSKEERSVGKCVFTCTRQGIVKKSDITEMPGATAHPFTLVRVNEGDTLGWVRLTDGKSDVLLATADGMAIRFSDIEVRPMGLVAAGVGGIKLGVRDEVIGMELLPPRGEVLLVTSDGKAKRCAAALFPKQGRYGQGVVAWKLPRTATLVGLAVGRPSTRVTLRLTKLAPKAMRLDEAPLQTRVASGKPVVEAKNVQVVSLTIPWEVPRAAGSKVEEEAKPAAKPATRRSAAEQLAFSLETATSAPSKRRTTRKAVSVTTPVKTDMPEKRAVRAITAKTRQPKVTPNQASQEKTPTAKRSRSKTPSTRTTRTKTSPEKAVLPKTIKPKTTTNRSRKVPGGQSPPPAANTTPTGAKPTTRKRIPSTRSSAKKESPSRKPESRSTSQRTEPGKSARKPASRSGAKTKPKTPTQK